MALKKHIFIGLGGSGCQTVAQIKEKVYANKFGSATETKSRLQAMNENYRFIFIDTDSRDIDEANKRNRKTFENGRVPFISPQTDLVNLGKGNPQAIWFEAKQDPDNLINKRILEACSPELAAKIPDQPLAFGAGAFRMKSRISFAHSLSDFQQKLQAAISALNDVKTVGGADFNIYYWVICSTLGGTGSGIINDVLYHVNMMHRQTVGDGDPQLILTMYMPKIYIDQNNTEEKYTLNAFGVFSEIEAFKAMSQEPSQNKVFHRMAFVNDYNLIDAERKYCPFYYLIPIDVQTDKGTSLGTQREMYRNTAELLYHVHDGQGGDTFRSDIDNYMNDIMERDHENFLVPMGYVSLKKPVDEFRNYMNFRLEKDLLRDWLLNNNEKDYKIEDSDKEGFYESVFESIGDRGDLYAPLASKSKRIQGEIEIDTTKEKLEESQYFDSIAVSISAFAKEVNRLCDAEEMKKTEEVLIQNLWKQAEHWIREKGLFYALNVIDAIRDEAYERYTTLMKANDKEVLEAKGLAQTAGDSAAENSIIERTVGSNKGDMVSYNDKVQDWFAKEKTYQAGLWRKAILKDFCADDKTDILAKVKNHLTRIKNKAEDKNNRSLAQYKSLAISFGKASLDVTTVYLPMMKDICDGNGWKPGNIFSKFYTKIIEAQEGSEEHAVRDSLKKFIDDNIYNTQDEKMQERIKKGEFQVTLKSEKELKSGKIEEEIQMDTRFFADPTHDRNPETIIERFLDYAQIAFEEKVSKTPYIQDNWENKSLSQFFYDLSNEQKDEVRNNLNPALFFSYNSDRIDVMKKEEHLVFVANSEDMAREMLGFEKGNPKHRFESDPNINTALVIKSKFGLSFKDYRIYDSIKMVYDKATFREKYHFHRDFAQHLSKITLDDLPDEIMPQHIVYAKMLLLNKFEDELKPLFYQDKYEPENYVSSILLDKEQKNTVFLACPGAISKKDDLLCIAKREKNRQLFDEISGSSQSKLFKEYMGLFFNHRYSDTLNNLLIAIWRQTNTVIGADGKDTQLSGATIIKSKFDEKRDELLDELNKMKAHSQAEDRRLYSIFFEVVKERLDTVQNFIGQ